MPARPSIAALAAVLALAAPATAAAQDEPGAGDRQHPDPLAPQPSQARQAQPPARTQAALQTREPVPTPDHEAGDQAHDRPQVGVAAPEVQAAPAPSTETEPGTGLDVLPLPAGGVVLLLAGLALSAGLALRRRPHARR